jgi:hypothetical protein
VATASVSAATSVSSVATASTAMTATFFGISTGTMRNRIRSQNDGRRQHATNCHRQ